MGGYDFCAVHGMRKHVAMIRAATASGVLYTPLSICAALRPSLTDCVFHIVSIFSDMSRYLLFDQPLAALREHSKRLENRRSNPKS